MAARPDYYKTLGRRQEGLADEIKKAYRKLARQYHPDRNPGDEKAEARFKEISGRLRRARRPREAQAVRPRRRAVRRRGPGGGFGGFGGAASTPAASATSSPTCSAARGGGGGGGAAGRPARRSAAATSRPRCRSRFDQAIEGAQVPLQVADVTAPARPAAAPAPSPAPRPTVCPRCQGRGIESAGPGPVLDLPAVLAAAAARAP